MADHNASYTHICINAAAQRTTPNPLQSDAMQHPSAVASMWVSTGAPDALEYATMLRHLEPKQCFAAHNEVL
jgi:hypothetical protein